MYRRCTECLISSTIETAPKDVTLGRRNWAQRNSPSSSDGKSFSFPRTRKMAHHARIEEVSDSEPEEMDIAQFAPPPRTGVAQSSSLIDPAIIPSTSDELQLQPQFRAQASQEAERQWTKNWTCIYPIYFDSTRTRAEGRRVGKAQSVENPLAREIVDAVQMLGLQVAFEPGKTHPKDWANPGRVRVLLKEGDKKVASNVNNSMFLFLPSFLSFWFFSFPEGKEEC